MIGINWKLGLIATAIMPIFFWTIRRYGAVIQSTSADRRPHRVATHDHHSALGGVHRPRAGVWA